MGSNEYIALIAEGAAERAILDILLDTGWLKYDRDDLLELEIIKTRSAAKFERKHLIHNFGKKKVRIFRILDSRNERFVLSKAYRKKVSQIIDLYTTPEIEILFIIYFDDYDEFCKKKCKPSQFVKENYREYFGAGNIKSYDNVKNFWEPRTDDLIETIKKYTKLTNNKAENTLSALLKL